MTLLGKIDFLSLLAVTRSLTNKELLINMSIFLSENIVQTSLFIVVYKHFRINVSRSSLGTYAFNAVSRNEWLGSNEHIFSFTMPKYNLNDVLMA